MRNFIVGLLVGIILVLLVAFFAAFFTPVDEVLFADLLVMRSP